MGTQLNKKFFELFVAWASPDKNRERCEAIQINQLQMYDLCHLKGYKTENQNYG